MEPSNLEEYGWKYNEYLSIYPYIYDKKYDKVAELDYQHRDVARYVPEDGKIQLYEIVTDAKNSITIDGTIYDDTEQNNPDDYFVQLSDIYLTKAESDLNYRRILGLGKENVEKYYDIDINDLNKRLELNLDDKITLDKVIARKYVKGDYKYINKPEATFYVYSDPKLDYKNESNPTLDLTHMVVAIEKKNEFTLVPFEKFGKYNIKTELDNGAPLTYEYDGKSIKVTMDGNLAYTTKPLKVPNDGFSINGINKIEVSTPPQLDYKIDNEPSDTKLNLNDLVLTLTSDSTIKPNGKVSRNIPYEDLKQYGIEIKIDGNAVDNETVLNLSDNDKKIIAYKGNANCEVGTLEVKDGIFREKKTNAIEVKTPPKTQYIVGEDIDPSAIVLEFTDSNENTKDYDYQTLLDKGFTFSLCGKDYVVEEPEQPEEPVEPEQPGEETPVDPEKPNDPADPGTNPVEPSDPEQPVDPEEPVEPSDPEQPVDPEEPVEPTDPEQPVDPEDPVEPTDPEQPNPEKPTEPTDPNATSLIGAEIYSAEDVEEDVNDDSNEPVDEDSNEESENPIETNETEEGPNCTPIENVTALQLIDNEKEIVVHGPSNATNDVINSFEKAFKISVEDKLRISYEFVSKDGTKLPEDVENLLPKDELVPRNDDYNVKPLQITQVEVSNGVWNFDGWDKDIIEKVQENTTIKGTWTFTKNPDPVVPDDPDTPDVPVIPEEPDDEIEPSYPGYDYFRPFNPDRSNRGRHKAGNQKKEEPKKKTEENKPVISEDKDYGFDIKDGNLPINLTDIPEGEVGDAIRNMVSRGILVGMTETEFQGEIGITRAMIGEVLMRMSKDKSLGDAPFSDVKPTDWFYDSVRWGVKHNIFKGYPDGTFRPNQNVSRQEFATIISRFLQMKGVNMPQINSFEYEDSNMIPMWSAAQVIEMNGTGLIVGKTETVYDAKGDYSRNELALTLNKIVNWIVQHSK